MPQALWTPEGVAQHYGVPLQTVYRWRTTGYGPRAIRVGRHLRYPVSEVERWDREQFATLPH